MSRFKTILGKIFVLPTLPTFLIAVPSFALVIYALVSTQASPVVQYVAYGLSAYALVIAVTWAIRLIILLRNDREKLPLLRWANAHPVVGRLTGDRTYRTKAKLLAGLVINSFYVAVELTTGVLTRSLWFLFVGAYHLMLVTMRLSLLRYMTAQDGRFRRDRELLLARRCGILLLVMNQALVFIVTMVVYLNRGYEYPGIAIYVMALYSFYAIISAAIHLNRQVRKNDPISSVICVISLTTAMVSIFSLETAMLAQFGQAEDPSFRQAMTGCTGAVICLCVLTMAVGMIVKSTRALRQMKKECLERNDLI